MTTKLQKFIRTSKYFILGVLIQMPLHSMVFAIDGVAQQRSLETVETEMGFDKTKITEVFRMIEKSTKLTFAYRNSDVIGRKVSLEKRKRTLSGLLNEISAQSNLSFKRIDGIIHVKPLKVGEKKVSEVINETRTIKGKVTDETGEGLPGATVQIKGETAGTITDFNGNYTLELPDGADILVVSFIGYKDQEISVGNRSVIDVGLKLDIQAMEEVVVVGYGVQEKRDVTGSVSQVSSEDISQVASVGFDQAIQGKVAGVQVTQNSGEPGGGVSVRIRGVGSINGKGEPLYIIDGVPVENANLNLINPNDIESIDVLKDAASGAIYGARASNGVVIVTTKKGQEGKARVSFNAYAGVQQPVNLYEMMNTAEFVALSSEAYQNTLDDRRFFGQNLPSQNPDWLDNPNLPNTNWQEEVFGQAPMQNYTLNISGGSKKMQGSLSAGYLEQEGILVGSGYERFNVRSTGDFQATDKLKFGLVLNVTESRTNSTSTNTSFSGALQTSLRALPLSPVRTDIDGPFGNALYGYEGFAFTDRNTASPDHYPLLVNPVYSTLSAPVIWSNEGTMLGVVYGELDITDDLKFRSSASLYTSLTESWNRQAPIPANIAQAVSDILRHSFIQRKRWNVINTLTYTKDIGKHGITALVGSDVLNDDFTIVGGTAQNLKKPNTPSLNGGEEGNPSGTYGRRGNISAISRINYSYDDKYLLSANFRADGSTQFGPGNKWGAFPSVSVGWRISNERFLKRVSAVSDLKIRASWGVVGNDAIANGAYFELIRFRDFGGEVSQAFDVFNIIYTETDPATGQQQHVTGAEPATLADRNVKWEETEEINFGIDLGLFKDKVTFTTDIYRRTIRDMLAFRPVPASFGSPTNSVLTNFASMRNSGVEFALSYRTDFGDFGFNVSGNYALQNNEVIDLNGQRAVRELIGVGAFPDFNPNTITEEGLAVAQFFGYQTDGIYQNQAEIDGAVAKPTWSVVPGDRRYKDINGDNVINDEDLTTLGNGLPKHIFGLTAGANYKNFDLNFILSGQAGVKAANLNKRYLYDIRDHGSNGLVNSSKDFFDNHWTGEGTSNTLPRVAYRPTAANNAFSDFHVEDASFVRLRSAQIGYTFPAETMEKLKITRLRLYVSGQNLLTFSKYSGIDPEVGSPDQELLRTGADHGRYPLSRILLAGLNLEF